MGEKSNMDEGAIDFIAFVVFWVIVIGLVVALAIGCIVDYFRKKNGKK